MCITVAIAYILHKYPYVVPIVGARKIEQLEANVKALEISLSEEQIAYLESIFQFDPNFPHKMIVCGYIFSFLRLIYRDTALFRAMGRHLRR